MVKRKDWESTQAAITTLTFDRLAAAAKSVHETNTHNDPTIRLLEGQIQTIASQVPQSFARAQNMRVHMRALFVSHGVPAFWMTINPADLKNPLVLKLAGVELSSDDLSPEAQRVRQTTANMNPVAVAQFFHQICTGVFDALLATGTDRIGILGQVSNYFGVVETNGRGMLHLHALIWLAGNLEFFTLRDRLQRDPIFAGNMIHYLNSIIKCSIDLAAENLEDERARLQPPSAKGSESDGEFLRQLHRDSNAVASKRQMHGKNHNRTCFKYAKNGTRECRFLFPRELVADTHVDEHGVIQLQRNNQWVTPWNPSLSSVLRSNHDISFIPTLSKALAAVYYMTNYATKYDVSQYQLILTASMVKRTLEDAKAATEPSEQQLRIRRQDMDKFALRAFNRLAQDREISGPQVASSLLNLPDYYTLPTKIRRLNLGQLRRRFEHINVANPVAFEQGEEPARVTGAEKAPRSVFDHYHYRGPPFSKFCLYDYVKLVTVLPIRSGTTRDIAFSSEHPDHEELIQRFSERMSPNTYTVALVGSLSENQALEDSVRGGHPETESMRNDLALILLALLVPWDQLPPRFAMFECSDQAYKGHCAEIWNQIEPSLPPHIQDVARNIELLRKSKADAQVDAALRKNARRSALSQDSHEEYSDNDDEDNDDVIQLGGNTDDDSVSLDTLYIAFSAIKDKWASADRQDAGNISPLIDDTRGLNSEIPALPDHDQALGTSPDFYNIDSQTLSHWREKLTTIGSGSQELPRDFDVDSGEEDGGDNEEDSLPPNEPNPIFPIIQSEAEADPTILQRINRVGPNPTGWSITQLIEETLPLNEKQRLVVKKILSHAIQHHTTTHVEAQDQMLLYVGGEGGVGKSRVIKAVELGYELLQRKSEVLLVAPTGAAAYNIGGRTIHNALSIDICDRPLPNISSYAYSLWKEKTIMIVDEISMVSLTMLTTINEQCNRIRAVRQDSTAILGAMPIVVFMGDFHQFGPIKAKALWQTPTEPREALGQIIWHRFTDVIILDEQMRQQGDLEFQGLVRRARAGAITAADVATLNGRLTQSLPLGDGLDTACVTRSNKRRHHINRLQIRRFAESRGQDIYVFPAAHSRTKRVQGGLRIDDLLAIQDGEGSAKGPGLFLYTRGMPATILLNVCTPLGLVNGAKGIAAGLVHHPNGKALN